MSCSCTNGMGMTNLRGFTKGYNMKTMLWFLLIVLSNPVLAFREVYYVRDDDGTYGLEDGSNQDNAFKGMSDVVYGDALGQVGPGDLLCVDGDVASSAVITIN